MQTRPLIWLMAAAAVGLACGDGGSAPSTADLAGTWTMTRCEYVSTGGLGSVELIGAGGTGTVTFNQDHTMSATVTVPGDPPILFDGTWEVDGIDLMRIHPGGQSWYWAFDMNLSGHTLTLKNGSAEYDFNNDGVPDPAKWNMTMTK